VKLPCLCAAALILSACGYIGEPMNPLLNIPMRVIDLAAVQRGSVIIYQFTLPALTTEGKKAEIGKVEIRIGPSGPPPFNQSEWEKGSTRMDVPTAGDVLHIRSEIPAAPWVGKDVAVGVKVYSPKNRAADWSNLVSLSVLAPLAKPAGVEAVATAAGVRVSWQGPAGQYRVFRRGEQDKEFALMATVEANEWVDTAAEYNKKYEYTVQALKKTGNGDVESDLSENIALTPIDTFPPAVPSGLNAIVGTAGIELVWDRDTEPDLAGYRLYRALEDGKLEKIADIADAPSYSDRKLETGKRYRYAVSAVDKLGNESQLSEPVEAIAP
jgi:hypothetical protein